MHRDTRAGLYQITRGVGAKKPRAPRLQDVDTNRFANIDREERNLSASLVPGEFGIPTPASKESEQSSGTPFHASAAKTRMKTQ